MIVLLLFLFLGQVPAANESPKLVNETGANARFRDGILELRGGSGWLRTEYPVLDFEVKFEIRALTPVADPGLIVRTWTDMNGRPDRGYRLTLPIGDLGLRPHGEWQSVHVVGQRGLIRLAVNDVVAAEFAIESQGGYLMFDNRKGRVEIRQITLRTGELNDSIPTNVISDKTLKKSGGTSPEILHHVHPAYTPEAMRARIQGSVQMEAVVLADGTVGPVRVTRSRDKDLDIAAVAALRAWRFRPAVLNGSPVPALIEVEMTFTSK